MKIHFDKVAHGTTYPVESKWVKRLLQSVPEEVRDRIVKIRFGCNQTTTQEARIVARGSTYEIRVNFVLVNGKSRLLSRNRDWLSVIENCGGVIQAETSEVQWSATAAQRYATFLLFHEIAHAVYALNHGMNTLHSSSSSSAEEKWCDTYAREAVAKLCAGM